MHPGRVGLFPRHPGGRRQEGQVPGQGVPRQGPTLTWRCPLAADFALSRPAGTPQIGFGPAPFAGF